MLTDVRIKAILPAEKPKKYFDERGLCLLVRPNGARWWRFEYQFNGNRKTISLGVYPDVSLKKAREAHEAARALLSDGVDPSAKRKSEKHCAADSFEAVALELITILRRASLAGETPPAAASEVLERTVQVHRKRKARQREPISADTIDTMERRLQLHVYPYIGKCDVKLLASQAVLPVLRRIEDRGNFDLAHRVRSIISRVLRYGQATGRGCTDVAACLTDLLVPYESEHMAAILDPVKIGELLRSIDGYRGEPVTRLALKLKPYLFPRPIEFRTMEWSQLNLDGDTPDWRVPWRRMKMRDPHVVPLSRQAVSILREIQLHTGDGRYVFRQLRKPQKPMSENAMTSALRAMGYAGDVMTDHGFRSMASTQLNELGWNDKWVEVQLAHAERNKSKKAYNHALYLPQRRAMMQGWADFLDELRAFRGSETVKSAESRAAAIAHEAFCQPDPYERFKQRQQTGK